MRMSRKSLQANQRNFAAACRVPGAARMTAKHLQHVFPYLRDKRMGEMTPAEQADAHEDWIRANYLYMRDPEHVSFILQRLDAERAKNGNS
jgi:hypothetical protein